MVLDLLEDKPTKYKIDCCKKILKGMIEEETNPPIFVPKGMIPFPNENQVKLDVEAEIARRELSG